MLMAMFTGHLLTVTQHVLFTSLGKLKSIQDGGVGKEVTIFGCQDFQHVLGERPNAKPVLSD